MKAEVGDWLVIEGRKLDAPRRRGVVVGLVHPDGSPPFRVRWDDDGHETLVVPGPEAHIEPAPGSAERHRRTGTGTTPAHDPHS